MELARLIDRFVASINSGERERLPLDEVPDFLREPTPDSRDWTRWKIVKADNDTAISALEQKIGRRFPPSFRYLLAHYYFPAFDVGPVNLFANTGHDIDRELNKRLFHDPEMSPRLLEGGFLQFGNPSTGDYDPVCFDLDRSRDEHPIVRLDHESILMRRKLEISQELFPSFIDLLKRVAGLS